MKRSLPLLLVMILIAACAVNLPRLPLEDMELMINIEVEESLDKVIYNPRSGLFYGLSRRWQQIHFYNGAKRVNSIGGIGTQKTNFQRLSDIAIDMDGSLLTLDSMSKTMRRFSAEGMWLSEIELKTLVQPELFAIAIDQSIYIYDGIEAEIVCLSMIDYTEQYRFGKFQLYRISEIYLGRDRVVAYSASDNVSHVYTRLGQYLGTEAGLLLFDEFENRINVQNGLMTYAQKSLMLGSNPNLALQVNRTHLCALSGSKISLYRLLYGRHR